MDPRNFKQIEHMNPKKVQTEGTSVLFLKNKPIGTMPEHSMYKLIKIFLQKFPVTKNKSTASKIVKEAGMIRL